MPSIKEIKQNNLMTYLTEYADVTFDEKPFSEADALVLCQMSYPKLDGIVPEDSFISWDELTGHPDAQKLYTDRCFGEMYREFAGRVAASRRYARVRLGHFTEKVSLEEECQFAAVTFCFPFSESGEDCFFVAYRGTDEKVIGWKEDFNIAHLCVLPSQELALEYLNRVPGGGPVMVGGHSKGGCEAVYAAACADPSVQKRLKKVYSFDGMGLGDAFYLSEGYAAIKDLVLKLVPQQSVIGTLFEKPGNYRVVASEGRGFKQHDFMNWKLENGSFVYLDGLDGRAEKFSEKLNRSINSLDEGEREKFVNTIYELILFCDPEDIYKMGDRIPGKALTVIRGVHELEKEEKGQFFKIFRKLLATMFIGSSRREHLTGTKRATFGSVSARRRIALAFCAALILMIAYAARRSQKQEEW